MTLTFERPPSRVVSLVPSVTETLFDLGAGEFLAGRTEYCIFPQSAAAVPVVGGTKNPRIDDIRALAPDLVHVNLEENLRRHALEIASFAPLFASEPRDVDGVLSLLAILGQVHGCQSESARWAGRIRDLRSGLRGATQFTFACPIWKDPWMWCGGDTYVSGLVMAAGGANVLSNETRYPARTVEEIASLAPDVIFLPDEPYLFTEDDARALRATVPRVVGPFPGHLFTWHGTRTAAGLEFLRDHVVPGVTGERRERSR